jgi:hypothetical protein
VEHRTAKCGEKIAAFLIVGGVTVYGLAVAAPRSSLQQEPGLTSELARRVKTDQDARKAMIAIMQKLNISNDAKLKAKTPDLFKRVEDIDRQNVAWMKEVVEDKGWPGRSLVGKSGAHDAWLLVQHADEDKPFQKKCLKLMAAMLPNGEVDKTDYAYLVDRVLVGEGKKQLYGTQTKLVKGDCIPDPVEDEANLDKRRKEMGMMPMAKYLEMVRKMYIGGRR